MELSMYTLLSIAKAHHASDLHITVGVRPKCRISGTLYEMDGFDKLTPAMTKELVESMFGPKQKATMEATGEVDFAYTDTRVGRFRVNAFHQRLYCVSWQAISRHRRTSGCRKLSLG